MTRATSTTPTLPATPPIIAPVWLLCTSLVAAGLVGLAVGVTVTVTVGDAVSVTGAGAEEELELKLELELVLVRELELWLSDSVGTYGPSVVTSGKSARHQLRQC